MIPIKLTNRYKTYTNNIINITNLYAGILNRSASPIAEQKNFPGNLLSCLVLSGQHFYLSSCASISKHCETQLDNSKSFVFITVSI